MSGWCGGVESVSLRDVSRTEGFVYNTSLVPVSLKCFVSVSVTEGRWSTPPHTL